MIYLEEKSTEKRIEENLELTRDIYEMARRNSKWVKFQKVWLVIQVIVIILIIVSLWVYILPGLRNISTIYEKTVGSKPAEVLREMKENIPIEIKK